ncbi:AtpZ/AtpI family protein [Crocinitomix catalasitica]|uniref:AtpZ/AtpI family protein n=1 Tax=Crocinitomix catalasitica TaxID=184607 RepID=UPI000480D4D4|nr:AtpZ/AtpI family protein [Crocinitomix catalasitica]
MSEQKKDSKPNAIARLSSAGIQMAIVIGGGAWGGSALDEHYQNEKPIWTIVCSLAGIAIGLYLVLKDVMKISKENDKTD